MGDRETRNVPPPGGGVKLSDEQRVSATKAVREAGGRLRAVPRADLEALFHESTGSDAEVARRALYFVDAEYARQLDAMNRVKGGPCRPSMLLDRTRAEVVEEDAG